MYQEEGIVEASASDDAGSYSSIKSLSVFIFVGAKPSWLPALAGRDEPCPYSIGVAVLCFGL